jgi:predicted GNAT family acetyltransferase
MPEEIDIVHQPEKQRFMLEAEGLEAELTYQLSGKTIIFNHTLVPDQLQHRGLANKLAETALSYAREENLQVDPQCRFMAVFIQRHKQYQDLLQKPMESHPLDGGTR